jgi:hypothetical protein
MKVLIARNAHQEPTIFKVLSDKEKVVMQPVKRRYDTYSCTLESMEMNPIQLPLEIVDRILMFTFSRLLGAYHFEDAYHLACISPRFIERVYYAIFGTAPYIDWQTKMIRLSSVINLLQEIYDNFITEEAVFDHPTVVLDWETVTDKDLFAPWSMYAATVIGLHSRILGSDTLDIELGPLYGDCVTMTRPRRNGVFLETGSLCHPIVPILVLNGLKICSTWNNPTTCYLFSRFAMLVKACFGPVYYFSEKRPWGERDDSDSDDVFNGYDYVYQEALNCVRQ